MMKFTLIIEDKNGQRVGSTHRFGDFHEGDFPQVAEDLVNIAVHGILPSASRSPAYQAIVNTLAVDQSTGRPIYRKIAAIKELRRREGLSLRDAKDAIEDAEPQVEAEVDGFEAIYR